MALHAVVEGHRLVVGGTDLMPCKGNHRSVAPLPLGLLNHGRTGEHGVLVVAGGEAEVCAEEAGIFTGQVVRQVRIARAGIWIVVLSRDVRVAGDGIKISQQRARLRRCMRVNRNRIGGRSLRRKREARISKHKSQECRGNPHGFRPHVRDLPFRGANYS